MIKPEIDLGLSIKALEVYGIEPNIIKSMLANLNKILTRNDSEMTVEEAIDILDRHQRWRLGADIEMAEPNMLTEAIDVILHEVIKYSESYQIVSCHKCGISHDNGINCVNK